MACFFDVCIFENSPQTSGKFESFLDHFLDYPPYIHIYIFVTNHLADDPYQCYPLMVKKKKNEKRERERKGNGGLAQVDKYYTFTGRALAIAITKNAVTPIQRFFRKMCLYILTRFSFSLFKKKKSNPEQ